MSKTEIVTGIYKESSSKRNPVYTTAIKSTSFGGRHYTLEELVKTLIDIPEVKVYESTNANDRESISKQYKITIEEIKPKQR